jgi:hypothetical protein
MSLRARIILACFAAVPATVQAQEVPVEALDALLEAADSVPVGETLLIQPGGRRALDIEGSIFASLSGPARRQLLDALGLPAVSPNEFTTCVPRDSGRGEVCFIRDFDTVLRVVRAVPEGDGFKIDVHVTRGVTPTVQSPPASDLLERDRFGLTYVVTPDGENWVATLNGMERW